MFVIIRRHQKMLFAVVGTITIASFVIFYPGSKTPGSGSRDRQGDYGSIGGRRITEGQYQEAVGEVRIQYYLSSRQFPDMNSPGLKKGAYDRLLLIKRQEDLGIQVDTKGAAAFARSLGITDSAYSAFLKELKPAGIEPRDVERYFSHQAGIEQLFNIAGLSGRMVTPAQAEDFYRLQHEDVHASLVYFPASRFLTGVPSSPEGAAQFYTDRMANYRINERVQVSYVKFNVTNYYARVETNYTNINKLVEDNYLTVSTNMFPDAKTPEEIKARIRDELLRGPAIVEAQKDANAFATELDNRPRRPEELEKLAAEKKLTVQTTAPFERVNGPKDIEAPPGFARDAFSLTPEEPFSAGIRARDGVYVLALKQKLPSEMPSFDSIMPKVISDFMDFQAFDRAVDAAADFANSVSNGLAQGRTFAQICAATNVTAEALPPFSKGTNALPAEFNDKVDFYFLKQVAFATPVGSPTQPLYSPDRKGVTVAFIEKKTPVSDDKLKMELPQFVKNLRNARQMEALNAWLAAYINQDPEFRRTFEEVGRDAETRVPRMPPGM